jgi:hypothetical protein
MTETSPELKPCPFCGSAKVHLYFIPGGGLIGCAECRAMSAPSYHPNREAEAAAAWNTRAQSPDHKALVDALELILPLALGYHPRNQTATAQRTCESWIDAANAALALSRKDAP